MDDQSWSLPAEDRYDVVAIACSAGGLRVLREILGVLPRSFPAPVLLAFHRGETRSDNLVRLLQSCTALAVKEARQGERPGAGTVYMAPGGSHLEVDAAGFLSVRRRGRVNFVCPSADVLLQSVALFYGCRSLAMVLTGYGRDGGAGARAIRNAGGFVIAQDPNGCECPAMPANAIETRKVDLVLPLAHLGYALNVLTRVAAR